MDWIYPHSKNVVIFLHGNPLHTFEPRFSRPYSYVWLASCCSVSDLLSTQPKVKLKTCFLFFAPTLNSSKTPSILSHKTNILMAAQRFALKKSVTSICKFTLVIDHKHWSDRSSNQHSLFVKEKSHSMKMLTYITSPQKPFVQIWKLAPFTYEKNCTCFQWDFT